MFLPFDRSELEKKDASGWASLRSMTARRPSSVITLSHRFLRQ